MILLFIIFILIPYSGLAGDIVVGKTYPIVEKDAINELQDKASSLNWNKYRASLRKKLESYRPPDWINLPHSREDHEYTTTIIHTLDFDITDKEGNVIYPAGYRFNPLEYISLPFGMVFIDGNDEGQVNWVKGYIDKHPLTRILIVDGPVFEVMDRLNRRVYYAGGRIIEKLQVRAVPSIVMQEGSLLRIKQLRVGDDYRDGNSK
jgi:conjugal transfer pilus assembly protein TraW